jgi:N-acetylglutamate synthase-like GNAT family acetyltransferase
MQDIELKIASKNDKIDITALVNMINAVYRTSEHNLWIEEHNRISNELLADIIQSKELLIVKINNAIVGCIHLEKMDEHLYKFKMLAVSPSFKGKRVGSRLVNFAEKTAIAKGAKTMQLELLVPTSFVHPDKVVLHNWYTKIGYLKINVNSVDYCHDGISQFLKTDCEAIIYQKPLI